MASKECSRQVGGWHERSFELAAKFGGGEGAFRQEGRVQALPAEEVWNTGQARLSTIQEEGGV